jgi:hypothetical protein
MRILKPREKSLLYGVSPIWALMFIGIALLMMVVALLERWIPARGPWKLIK